MIYFNSAPLLLLMSLSLMSFLGLVVLWLGDRLPGRGIWMAWIGIIVLLSVLLMNLGVIPQIEFYQKAWHTGWVWPKGEIGALTIGILQSALGQVIGVWVVLLCGLALLRRSAFSGALVLSAAGVVLAWNSSTPWLVLVGLLITLVGGFVSYRSQWSQLEEADAAIKFIRIRAIGLLLTLFGACVLASTRAALLFDQPKVWLEGQGGGSTLIGAILLAVGLFIQMACFPFLRWAISNSEGYSAGKSLVTQIYPAWAAFIILMRLHGLLKEVGLFPTFGWIALICSSLTVLTGLFQKNWQNGLRVWLSSGFALSIALLALSGPSVALGMLLGYSLGGFVLANIGEDLNEEIGVGLRDKNGKTRNATSRGPAQKRLIGLKTLAVLSVFLVTGGFGFVSSISGIKWVLTFLDNSGSIPFFLLSVFLSVLLGWKLLWRILRVKNTKPIQWVSFVVPSMGIFLGLSVLWTGTISGEIFLHLPDRIMPSIFGIIFEKYEMIFPDFESTLTAAGLYWGVLTLAIIAAYWFSGRKEDRWALFATNHPRFGGFVENGYGVEKLGHQGILALISFGRGLQTLIDDRIWMTWVPRGLFLLIQSIGKLLNQVDEAFSRGLGQMLALSVDYPGRFLQLIQTGDLRWYIIFVFGSSFLVILHYLYF